MLKEPSGLRFVTMADRKSQQGSSVSSSHTIDVSTGRKIVLNLIEPLARKLCRRKLASKEMEQLIQSCLLARAHGYGRLLNREAEPRVLAFPGGAWERGPTTQVHGCRCCRTGSGPRGSARRSAPAWRRQEAGRCRSPSCRSGS